MATVDVDRVWHIIVDLVEMGRREDAEVIKNLKDDYIKLSAIFHFNSTRPPFGEIADDERINFMSAEAGKGDWETFIRWDINRRQEGIYDIERGSAVEWHWAHFLVNRGPVTMAMVEHASNADPEGWGRAASELRKGE